MSLVKRCDQCGKEICMGDISQVIKQSIGWYSWKDGDFCSDLCLADHLMGLIPTSISARVSKPWWKRLWDAR